MYEQNIHGTLCHHGNELRIILVKRHHPAIRQAKGVALPKQTEDDAFMINWNNLDTLPAFDKLENTRRVELARPMPQFS